MSTRPSNPHPQRWRRFWKPAAITAGGATVVAWLEEIIATAAELIGVIFMIVMTGVIYLFNLLVFKFASPKADNSKHQ